MIVKRRAERELKRLLEVFPAVMLLGARQVGKTTLARKIAASRASVLFDLENRAEADSLYSDPVGQLCRHDGKLIVLDEVQKVPEIFEAIRVAIDRMDASVPGRFLLLGSASGKLLNQSKENLFGRVGALELFGLDCLEIHAHGDVARLWNRGGFPRSYLASSDEESMLIRRQMCRQMFSDNLAGTDSRVSAGSLTRLLMRLAQQQGGVLNMQEIAADLEVSHVTVKRHIVMLTEMMLLRELPAFAKVGGQSSVRRPKYYIRDSGILHSLCNAPLAAAGDARSDVRGASWEGFVIENIMAVLPSLWQASFYRNRSKHEIDLVLQVPGGSLWAIEIKSAADPDGIRLSRGNLKAIEQLQPDKCFVVHGGDSSTVLANDVVALSLPALMNELRAQDAQVSAGPPSLPASMSSRLSALLAAAEAGTPNVSILRERFLDFCVQQIDKTFSSSRGVNDAETRRVWLGLRDEMVEWLVMECKLDAAGSRLSPSLAKSLRKLLEAILSSKLMPSLAGREQRGCIVQADLCACEMFVHCIAVLLDNDKFKAVRDLLERGYVAAEKLRNYREFYYGSPEGRLMRSGNANSQLIPAAAAADELYEHLQASKLKLSRLIEAEQVIYCSGVNSGSGREIFPHILLCAPEGALCPLDFFLRAQSAQDQDNLVECLEESADESFSSERFKKELAGRMGDLLADNKRLYMKWREILAIDDWP